MVQPAQAFGTGHHPTTAGALRAIESIVDRARAKVDSRRRHRLRHPGDRGGADRQSAPAEIVAIDIDPTALENARANARLNGVEKSIRFSAVPLASIHRHFDLIVANILSGTLIELAPALAANPRARRTTGPRRFSRRRSRRGLEPLPRAAAMSQPQDASRMDDASDGASAPLMPATPPRFSIAHAPDATSVAHVDGAELHHMRAVLRLAVGAGVSLTRRGGRGASRRDRALRTRPRSRAHRVILDVGCHNPDHPRRRDHQRATDGFRRREGGRVGSVGTMAADLRAWIGAFAGRASASRDGDVWQSPRPSRVSRASAMEVRAPIGIDDLIRGVARGRSPSSVRKAKSRSAR